jgi:hypothetical protein
LNGSDTPKMGYIFEIRTKLKPLISIIPYSKGVV